MEVLEPVTREIIPLVIGKRTVEIPFETRAECREVIRVIALACERLPDDGEPAAPAGKHSSHRQSGALGDMRGDEIADAYLNGRDHHELKALLLFISGYCPAALAAAIAEHPRKDDEDEPESLPQRTPGPPATYPDGPDCICAHACRDHAIRMSDRGRGQCTVTGCRCDTWSPGPAAEIAELADLPPCQSENGDNEHCARFDGHQPPHRTLVGEKWDDGPEPYQVNEPLQCGESDGGWRCNAQRGHGGPDHIAYVGGRDSHRWPVTPVPVPMPGVLADGRKARANGGAA